MFLRSQPVQLRRKPGCQPSTPDQGSGGLNNRINNEQKTIVGTIIRRAPRKDLPPAKGQKHLIGLLLITVYEIKTVMQRKQFGCRCNVKTDRTMIASRKIGQDRNIFNKAQIVGKNCIQTNCPPPP